MYDKRTYRSWRGAMDRCYNPRHHKFAIYGAAGVKVCERWHTYKNFLTDMGARPFGKTIDRLDSRGDYCQSNCEWADAIQQNFNRSSTIAITIDGRVNTFKGWCKEYGLIYITWYNRFRRGAPLASIFGHGAILAEDFKMQGAK